MAFKAIDVNYLNVFMAKAHSGDDFVATDYEYVFSNARLRFLTFSRTSVIT